MTTPDGATYTLDHGAVAIAAITSCTNTSNPSRDARGRPAGPQREREGPEVEAVGQDHARPGLEGRHRLLREVRPDRRLEELGFYTVGYGCTICIGNTGPLIDEVSAAINDNDLAVTAVLSGNRNFEGRISPDVKMNYLACPPLVIAYALAGSMNFDFETDALGTDTDGNDVFLKDIWPDAGEVQTTIDSSISTEHVHQGVRRASSTATSAGVPADARRRDLRVGRELDLRAQAPVLRRHDDRDSPRSPTSTGARVLAKLGDSVTTDHISPAGTIKADSPAGRVPARARRRPQGLQLLRLASRQPRGDDPRHVREHPAARTSCSTACEGGYTRDFTQADGPQAFIYDASQNYQAAGTPLVIFAGKEYGSGSSRDWAAKGTNLLGVKAVIAESFERIHRSNLIGMGVIPLQFPAGETLRASGSTAPRS